MAGAHVTQADIENRLSAQVVAQILDDDNDGSVDAGPIAQVVADAKSYVAGFLRGNYDLDAIDADVPNEVRRLELDVAVGYLAIRHPEYVRFDGGKLLDRARAELMDLRMGKTRLDVVSTPEPAANEGGQVRSGNPDDTAARAKFFADGTGDF